MVKKAEKPWYRHTVVLIVFFWAIIIMSFVFDLIDITRFIKVNLRYDWPSIICQALILTISIVFGVVAIKQAKNK